jgi:transposase
VVEHLPARCPCGACLEAQPVDAALAPRRHQVWELPEPKAEVTEHRQVAKRCPECGKACWGQLPPDVPRTGQGPRLEAAVVLLTGSYRMSKANAASLLRELWGVPISSATVSAVEARLTSALSRAMKEILKAVLRAAAINVDETVWWEAGKRLWLWMAVAAGAVWCRIDPSRSREAFGRLLEMPGGKPQGPDPPRLTSDRYAAYMSWPSDRHRLPACG